MTRGAGSGGYTVIEILVVMGITAAMFASAVVAFQGQQANTEYTQASHDVETKIRDTLNRAVSGRYDATSGFTCSAVAPGAPVITNGAGPEQGAHFGCTYLGKVIQVAPADVCSDRTCMNIYTVAGRQKDPTGKEVTSLVASFPRVVTAATERYDFKYGLKATAMYQLSGRNSSGANCPCQIGSAGFFMSLGKYDSTTGDIISSSTTVDTVPITNSQFSDSSALATGRVDGFLANNETYKNPTEGVLICFRDSRDRRKSGVLIGRNGRLGNVEILMAETVEQFTSQAKFGGSVTCP